MDSVLRRHTTITVSEQTRRLLEAVKAEGESFDDLIQDILEETYFDDAFYQEIQRRWETERRIPGKAVLAAARLS